MFRKPVGNRLCENWGGYWKIVTTQHCHLWRDPEPGYHHGWYYIGDSVGSHSSLRIGGCPDGALLLPPFLSVTLYIVQKPVQSWMPLEIENYSLPKWKREPLLWHRECCLFSDFLVAPHCVPPASVSAPAKCPCPLFDWNAHSFDTCFGYLHLDRAFLTHLLSLLWPHFGCPALLLFYPWHFFTH